MAEKNSLWKNIRNKAAKNKRTGAKPKKPTAEMLRQERKIKAKKYAEGGKIDPPDGRNNNVSVAERELYYGLSKAGDALDWLDENLSLINIVSPSIYAKMYPYFAGKKAKEYYFNNYSPVEYPNIVNATKPLIKSAVNTITTLDPTPTINRRIGYDKQGDYDIGEEAWRKSLNLPIKEKYIVKSKYKPTIASPNDKSEYYTLNPDIFDKQKIIDYVKSKEFEENSQSGKSLNTRKANVEGFSRFMKDDFMPTDEFKQIDPLQNFQVYKAWDPEKKTMVCCYI
jgi:hypothetical protein